MWQRILLAALIVSCVAALAHAQSVPPDVMKGLAKDLANLQAKLNAVQNEAEAVPPSSSKWVKITAPKAPVHAGAGIETKVVFTAAENKSFPVLDKAGDWYAIGFGPGRDTGWVHASDVAPFQLSATGSSDEILKRLMQNGARPPAVNDASVVDRMYETITEEASAIRDKYATNKYIRVTGFAVNVGIPPSVSMNFEFK